MSNKDRSRKKLVVRSERLRNLTLSHDSLQRVAGGGYTYYCPTTATGVIRTRTC